MEYDNSSRVGDNRSDNSEFSGTENNDKKSKKEKNILGTKKKDKKKEKETRYATLGDESSGDEEGGKVKKSKKKGFQFGSAKKEKKEKKERDGKESKDIFKKEKKDKEKEKSKLKIKMAKIVESEIESKSKSEECAVFGVPLEVAVERRKCHDGIKLPVVVRECVDYIEENGLNLEGIYRSSGVKSKINKLKSCYNTKQSVSLVGSEPAVVASLLKLFLRELPDPVLTHTLSPKFEEVSCYKDLKKRQAGFSQLVNRLPECNRLLLEWIFVHMTHVIERERVNKMTLQNVSIVLSPTMQISHRVLYCFFEQSATLFRDVVLKKYVPPISGQAGLLPESPEGIEEEMKKQESLLEELHKEISLGVASKATEEQLWEQQRIVTQLKRNLRLARSKQSFGDAKLPEFEEELNFSLQTPKESIVSVPEVPSTNSVGSTSVSKPRESQQETGSAAVAPVARAACATGSDTENRSIAGKSDTANVNPSIPALQGKEVLVENSVAKSTDSSSDNKAVSSVCLRRDEPQTVDDQLTTTLAAKLPDAKVILSSPETDSAKSGSQEHRITVQIHQEEAPPKVKAIESVNITRIQLTKEKDSPPPFIADNELAGDKSETDSTVKPVSTANEGLSAKKTDQSVGVKEPPAVAPVAPVFSNVSVNFAASAVGPPPPAVKQQSGGGFPLLPPPPSSSKNGTRALGKQPYIPNKAIMPLETRIKSKSLPRGLPSDGSVFDKFKEKKKETRQSSGGEQAREQLLTEEMRLKFEYEELLNLKSELERRKKTERREVAELQEEIATMQTLYQYRTYNVDSSEESGEEEEETHQAQADRIAHLRKLAKEQVELEKKKLALLYKLQEERAACVKLRVQIRLEQERLKQNGLYAS